VLTVFERLTFAQLPFYLELMQHLARRGLPVPSPRETHTGALMAEARASRWPSSTGCQAAGSRRPRRHSARRWAPCWRACTWRPATSRASSQLRGIGWWKDALVRLEPKVATTCSTSWPRGDLPGQLLRSPRFEQLPSGRSTPICSATTCCGTASASAA